MRRSRLCPVSCLLLLSATASGSLLFAQPLAPTGDLVVARTGHTATLLPSGKVLITGGESLSGPLASAELYDPATKTFSLTGNMTRPRDLHTATQLSNGKVLIAGGHSQQSGALQPIAVAELYDPATGTFTDTGAMVTPRVLHSAIPLPDGKVLLAGGSHGSGLTASVEIYDPDSGRFSATGGLATPRWLFSALPLPDGKVLIAGGNKSSVTTSDAEIFDPATRTFSFTGKMVVPRAQACATALTDGRVLFVSGAFGSTLVNSAETYDPQSGMFSFTAFVVVGRKEHTCTLLPDGAVLIAGGALDIGSSSVTDALEIYDPKEQAFRAEGHLVTAPRKHSSTLLRNGQELIWSSHLPSYTGPRARGGEPWRTEARDLLHRLGQDLVEGPAIQAEGLIDEGTIRLAKAVGNGGSHACSL